MDSALPLDGAFAVFISLVTHHEVANMSDVTSVCHF